MAKLTEGGIVQTAYPDFRLRCVSMIVQVITTMSVIRSGNSCNGSHPVPLRLPCRWSGPGRRRALHDEYIRSAHQHQPVQIERRGEYNRRCNRITVLVVGNCDGRTFSRYSAISTLYGVLAAPWKAAAQLFSTIFTHPYTLALPLPCSGLSGMLHPRHSPPPRPVPTISECRCSCRPEITASSSFVDTHLTCQPMPFLSLYNSHHPSRLLRCPSMIDRGLSESSNDVLDIA